MTYFPSTQIVQNVTASAINSSTSNLLAGGTFTGLSESTLGVAGIQVNIATDQNCAVYIEQSMDGTNWDISDRFNYYYTSGGNSWTTQSTASYFRVRVTNLNSLTATTYFRLQTALCPIVEALPRALDSDGSLKVCVVDFLEDGVFPKAKGTPMGELRVEGHSRLVGSSFTGTTFDTNFWTKTTQTGTGDASQANAQLTLTTGATANSSIIVNSVMYARYVGSYGTYYRGAIRTPAVSIVTGSNVKRWGAFSATNGFFLEYNGTTLSMICRKTSSDTNKISSGSFNGVMGLTYVLDANVHVYEIYWTNRSAWFFIDDKLIHQFSGLTTQLSDTTTLPVGMQCTNSGGNTGVNTLEVRSSSINRLGPLSTEASYKSITTATTTTLKYGAGRLIRIVVNDVTNPTAGNVTIYDSITGGGTIIATVYVPKNNAANPFSLEFGCPFHTGLTIVTDQASKITVIYE